MASPFYLHQETLDSFRGHQFKVLTDLRQKGALTDVTVWSAQGTRQIKAHKVVLAASSDYFCTMFKDCFAESATDELELHEVPEDVLEPLIDYFYTGGIRIDGGNVANILNAGSLLLLPTLIEACITFMTLHLDPENCLEVRELSVAFGLDNLKHRVDTFICENFMFAQEYLLTLDKQNLQPILFSDDLSIESEEVVFDFVLQWMEKRSENLIRFDKAFIKGIVNFYYTRFLSARKKY